MERQPCQDELDRQIRELKSAWHYFKGPLRKHVEEEVNEIKAEGPPTHLNLTSDNENGLIQGEHPGLEFGSPIEHPPERER